MWRRICTLVTVLVAASTMQYTIAQDYISPDSVRLVRCGENVQLVMRIDVDQKKVGPNDVVIVEPILGTQGDSVAFPIVGVYGRNTYYYQVRGGAQQLQPEGSIKLRAKTVDSPLIYAARLPYKSWMDRADVKVRITTDRLCKGTIKQIDNTALHAKSKLIGRPDSLYRTKGVVEGKAYIDFVVNRTEIRPDYHGNSAELQKIENSIDSVRSNPTATIEWINIKGYASPEGPYDNNVRLARGRSESLRQYMIDHFGINEAFITSDYEPEDWEGLRKNVEESTLQNKIEILEIIDSDESDLDKKLARIKVLYPKDYRYILDNFMPYLRHSDYRIDYVYYTDHLIRGDRHTEWAMPTADQLIEDRPSGFKPFHPAWALKSNLLFDVAGALNIEVEVPFGKERRWSVMLEDWFPWYVWHHNSRAYEVWTVGGELRRWFGRCPARQPLLTGTFAGLYAAGGKYDVEWNSKGYQGEFGSFGLTIGHSWALSKHWNLEASLSAGVVFGPQRRYHGEFNDSHLIWQRNDDLLYFGPTKAKVSLVWLLESPFKKGAKRHAFFDKKKASKKEGGAR